MNMEEASKQDKLRIAAEQHKQEMQQHLETLSQQKKKKLRKTAIIFGIIFVIIAGFVVQQVLAPGAYDEFAKCLNAKGAVIYGAIEWCAYTKEQAGMFGKSFKYLNYKDYKEIDNIKKTPTWVFNGERYEGVQSFERLAQMTGCTY